MPRMYRRYRPVPIQTPHVFFLAQSRWQSLSICWNPLIQNKSGWSTRWAASLGTKADQLFVFRVPHLVLCTSFG